MRQNRFHSLIQGLTTAAVLASLGTLLVSTLIAAEPLERIALTNACGLSWELQRLAAGWTLGGVKLNGKLTAEPLIKGVMLLRNRTTGKGEWLAPAEGKAIDGRTARFTGRHRVGDTTLSYQMELSLAEGFPAARLLPSWSADKEFAGWEVCLAWHEAGSEGWRCTLYPWAGNATSLSRDRLTYCGVPSAILFRPDLSLVTLFGIAPEFDYLNPTTWTGDTGFHFKAGITAPQFRVGGGKLRPGVEYQLPLQLFLSDAGNSAEAITALVRNWIKLNHYRAEPLRVRSYQEGFELFVRGRKKGRMWHEGLGYQISHTEQENYLQYSNYCYNNRKYYCLNRLAQLTGQPLFSELCDRVIQCGFWAQPTDGEWIGGMNERMSDPWLALSKDFNSTAQVYTGELATDAALQLLELGFGTAANQER